MWNIKSTDVKDVLNKALLGTQTVKKLDLDESWSIEKWNNKIYQY